MAMRVNLGSGDCYAPGWVNVDHGTPHGHDITADLTKTLPIELTGIAEAYAGHVLEHLHHDQVVTLLADLRWRMRQGGELMVVGPDVDRAQAMHDRGELDAEWLRLVIEGGDRWPGDRHLWKCRPGRLVEFLTMAGWSMAREVPILSVSPINWPIVSHAEWQCAVTAYA